MSQLQLFGTNPQLVYIRIKGILVLQSNFTVFPSKTPIYIRQISEINLSLLSITLDLSIGVTLFMFHRHYPFEISLLQELLGSVTELSDTSLTNV